MLLLLVVVLLLLLLCCAGPGAASATGDVDVSSSFCSTIRRPFFGAPWLLAPQCSLVL